MELIEIRMRPQTGSCLQGQLMPFQAASGERRADSAAGATYVGSCQAGEMEAEQLRVAAQVFADLPDVRKNRGDYSAAPLAK